MARIVETQRLLIREFDEKIDAGPLYELTQDKGINLYSISGYKFKDLDHARKWIQARREESNQTGYGTFPLVRKKDPAIVGLCGLRLIELKESKEYEVMYRLAEPYWGKGFATEALQGLLDYGFIVKKLPKMVAIVVPENTRSKEVIKKVEMSYVKNVVYKEIEHELHEITKPA